METHKKFWGSEEWIVNNENYCGKFLNLTRGYQCSLHYHKKKDETFHILEGKVLMEVDGLAKIMIKDESVRILPNQKHRFTGIEDSRMLEISTHHEEEDSYREIPSGKVNIKEIYKQ